MGESGLMVAAVDAAGTILAANGAFAVRAAGPERRERRDRGQPAGRHLTASAEDGQFHFAARRQGVRRRCASSRCRPATTRARPRSSSCSTTFRARAATTRTRMSTPCSTASRSASRWPTGRPLHLPQQGVPQAAGLGASERAGLARRSRRRRGQGRGLRRGPPLRPRPADVGRSRGAAEGAIPRSRWR